MWDVFVDCLLVMDVAIWTACNDCFPGIYASALLYSPDHHDTSGDSDIMFRSNRGVKARTPVLSTVC